MIDRQVADGHVHPVQIETREGQRRRDPCVDLRMGEQEPIQPWREPFRGKPRRRADHQDPAVALRIKRRNRLSDLREPALQTGVKQPSGLGQRHRAGESLKQRNRQEFLQRAYLVA